MQELEHNDNDESLIGVACVLPGKFRIISHGCEGSHPRKERNKGVSGGVSMREYTT